MNGRLIGEAEDNRSAFDWQVCVPGRVCNAMPPCHALPMADDHRLIAVQPCPGHRALPDHMRVWRLALDPETDHLDAAGRHLPEVELRQLTQAPDGPVRRRRLQTRIALRRVLARRLGGNSAQVPLAVTAAGRPHVARRNTPQFSVSHCLDVALIAVADDGSPGVDVERVHGHRARAAVAARWFSAAEQGALARVADRQAWVATFLRIWVGKEAVVKASGLGVGLSLPGFDVLAAPGQQMTLGACTDPRWSPERANICELDVGAAHVAAIVWGVPTGARD